MGRTTGLRREIKRTFVPYLAGKGFACDMRDAPAFFTFRKIARDAVYVCDIQWDKYGRPRFTVNFGKCSPEGVTLQGRRVLPADIRTVDTPEWRRLHRRAGAKAWFRQDRPLAGRLVHFSKLYDPAEVVTKLIALFGEVEAYWNTGRAGPHLSLPLDAVRGSRGSRSGWRDSA